MSNVFSKMSKEIWLKVEKWKMHGPKMDKLKPVVDGKMVIMA